MEIKTILIDEIRPDPNQPRSSFDTEKIKLIATSIRGVGLINDILVDRNYMLISGELRWRAAKLLGWPTMPAIIYPRPLMPWRRLTLQLAENLNPVVTLTSMELAKGFERAILLHSNIEPVQRLGLEQLPNLNEEVRWLAQIVGRDESQIWGILETLKERRNFINKLRQHRSRRTN